MSDDKEIQALVLKSVENESSYRQLVPGILNEINAGKKPYITNTLKTAVNVITGSKYDASLKCYTLLLIKDIMQLNQGAFIQALADSKVMGTLESLALKNPKSEKEYEKVFGEKPEAKHTKRFYILMMECIKVWGNKFQDQKGISQKYTTVLNNLIKKKIPIPEKFYYFPDKDNAKQAPKAADSNSSVQAPAQLANSNKAPAPSQGRSEQQQIQLIQQLSQKYEEVIAQAFCYYSQDIEVDNDVSEVEPVVEQRQNMTSPQNQVIKNEPIKQANGPATNQDVPQLAEDEEELFPLMYCAQELEVDGPDEYLPVENAESSKAINKGVLENKDERALKAAEVEKQQKLAEQEKERVLEQQRQQKQAELEKQQRQAQQEKERAMEQQRQQKQAELEKQQRQAESEKQQKQAQQEKERAQEKQRQDRQAELERQQRQAEQEKERALEKQRQERQAELERQQRQAEQEKQQREQERQRLAAEKEKYIEQERQQRKAEEDKQQKAEQEKMRKIREQERAQRLVESRDNQPKIDINFVVDTESIKESINEQKKPKFTKLDAENRMVDPENSIRPDNSRGSRIYSPDDSGFVPLPVTQELSNMKKRPKEIEVIEYEPPVNQPQGNGNRGTPVKSAVKETRISPSGGAVKKVSFDEKGIERDSKLAGAIKIQNEARPPSKNNLDPDSGKLEQQTPDFIPPIKYSSPRAEAAGLGFLSGLAKHTIPEPVQRKQTPQGKEENRAPAKQEIVKAQVSPKEKYLGAFMDENPAIASAKNNANPLLQTREMEQLKQRNDVLQAENERIKNELLVLEHKMKSEKDQGDRRAREYEPVRAHHEQRSNSSTGAGKISRKTEMAATAGGSTRNRFMASDLNTYHAGRSLSNTNQPKVRGRSPKVEQFNTFNMAATASTFGVNSFGADLRRLNQMYGPDYFAQSTSGDQGYKFASTGSGFYQSPNKRGGFIPSPNKRRQELSPGAVNTMNKTELLQQRTWNEPFSKKYAGSQQKFFSRHDDLPFSTNLYRFKLACLRDDEVLYEDDNFRIESKTYYIPERAGILVVELIYTNKGEVPINDFAVTYKSIAGFDIRPEETALSSVLTPGESQHHQLNTEVNGYPRDVGLMVVEFRLENEPRQLKLNFPLIMTKFLTFKNVNSAEYNKKRKSMLANHSSNVEESIKLRINRDHLDVLQDTLFGKMTPIPVEGASENRFNIYGGCVTIGTSQLEYILRIIVEIETNLMLIQVIYPFGGEQDAKLLLEKLIFLCNETSLL